MQSDWLTSAAAPLDAGGSALPPGVLRSAGLLLGFALALAFVLRILWSLKRLTAPPAYIAPGLPGVGGHGANAGLYIAPADSAPVPSPRAGGESGHAVTEFALVFPFALMLVLLVVQVALMLQANLVVSHAAFCAARCAQVWIPRPMANLSANPPQNGRNDGPNQVSSDQVDSPKTLRMQLAAAYACWPIAGTLSRDFASQLLASRPWAAPVVSAATGEMRLLPGAGRVFGVYNEEDFLNKYLYSVVSTRVMYQAVVPISATPPERGHFGPDMFVRVAVEHDFALRIPFAGRILGVRQTTVGADQQPVPDEDHLYVTTLSANAMLSNEGRQEYPPGVNGR